MSISCILTITKTNTIQSDHHQTCGFDQRYQDFHSWYPIYTIAFTITKNNMLDATYSMLLCKTSLEDAKVFHNWGTNLVTIEDNGIIKTMVVTKKLSNNIKWSKVLMCYELVEGIMNEEEKYIFVIKLDLFSIKTITLS